jgi:hypothetical protein
MMVDYLPMMNDFDFSDRGLLWIYPNAQTGMIFRQMGGVMHLAASHGPNNQFMEYVKSHPIAPGQGAATGRAALEAAAHPAPGESLFFVATGDGGHVFSATYEQHRKAVKTYQLKP